MMRVHMELSRAATAGAVLGLALSAGLFTGPAAADAKLGYGKPGTVATQFMEVGAEGVRMSQPGQTQWLLYRDAQQSVYIVDDTQRSYQKMDKEMAARLGAQISAMQAQVDAQLAMLPPEQREMMKGMMPKMPDFGARKYSVESKGAPRQVAGYECQPVQVLEDGKAVEEICLGKIKALGLSEADFALLKRMGSTMGAVASSFGAGSMAAVLEKMEGLPVEHRKPGAATAELELLQLDKGKQAAERFVLPEGYTQTSLFPGMGG